QTALPAPALLSTAERILDAKFDSGAAVLFQAIAAPPAILEMPAGGFARRPSVDPSSELAFAHTTSPGFLSPGRRHTSEWETPVQKAQYTAVRFAAVGNCNLLIILKSVTPLPGTMSQAGH